ncbi:MAG: hypothetical protein UT66_C0008G0008 [candidate division CPR2 bacterium GW2011_GWC1_39_9]|uniref:Uncharacterized protein n=1 Tax=candidate division CPR2 bacterium GW2011_GWC2_39_10 TaxID=1618345 RepID=A0A0G0LTB6_UNCC2|nr:MAG: hypothetical protein UT18_C0003G0027 [candidate division CPR2 bacterium GW2011_GWC2_39_10]KKR35666.1 MAG: hypothetical protein UT66_C0008G0008 [candidate division CPR2 bacterium GW2011_GWC1_39_9]
MKKFNKVKIPLMSLFVILIAVAFFYLYKTKYDKTRAIVTIGDKKITQMDLNKRIYSINFEGSADNPQQISEGFKKELVDELVEKTIVESAAARLGINVADDAVDAFLKEEGIEVEGLDNEKVAIVRENVKYRVTKLKVEERVVTKKEGEYIKIRFDKFHSDNLGGTEQQTSELRNYAQKLAEDLYKKLNTGTITFQQGVDIVEKDPVIDIKGIPGKLDRQGGYFKPDTAMFINADFKKKLKNMTLNTISEPFVITLPAITGEGAKYVDSAFIIAKITKVSDGEADSFSAWIAQQKKSLNIERS